MASSDSASNATVDLPHGQALELVQALDAVARESSVAGLARAAAEAVCMLGRCEATAFYLLNGERLQCLALSPAQSDKTEASPASLPLEAWEPLHALVAEPHTLLLHADANDRYWPAFRALFPRADEFRHYLLLPLSESGRVLGLLCAAYQQHLPDRARQRLLERFDETLTHLLRTALLLTESATRARLATLRMGMARHSWEAPDRDSLLRDACTGISTALRSSGCAIYLEHGGMLAQAALRPEMDDNLLDGLREASLLPLLAHVVSTGRSVQVQDVVTDRDLPEVVRAVRESLLAAEIRSLLIVPLFRDDVVHGALVTVHIREAQHWEPGEVVLVEQLAGDIAVALAQQDRVQTLQRELAERDAERAQFTAAVDELPIAVLVADHALPTYAWWNQAAEVFVGFPADQASRGGSLRPQFNIRRPDGVRDAQDDWPLMRALREGSAVPPEELLVQDSEGELLPMLVAASPLRGGRGQVQGALAAFVNLTASVGGVQLQRRLSEARKEAMAEERERIAREIHDVLAQTITSIVMVLDAIGKATPQEAPTFARVAQARALARSAVAEIRRLAWRLRASTVDLEMPQAVVETELTKLQQRMDLRPAVSSQGEQRRLAPEIGSLLQRVLGVVIDNIAVHSSATEVQATLTYEPEKLIVRVEDNGRGFDSQRLDLHDGSMTSLEGLAERTRQLGGALQVESAEGSGTRVQVELPYAPSPAGQPRRVPLEQESTPVPSEKETVRIRTMIIDDHTMVREGLIRMLQDQPDLEVVGEAATGSDGLRLIADLHPDVVLCDLQLPDLSGSEVIARVHAHFPEIRCLVVTTYDSDEFIYESMKAGAKGYVLKDVSAQELGDAVRAAARNESLLQPVVARKLVERFGELARQGGLVEPLTEREIDVLRSVASGLRNKEIAFELGLSESTIKTHLASIFGKLNVTTRTEAVARGRELGIIAL